MTRTFEDAPQISIVTPAYNEGLNLPVMHQRLEAVLRQTGAIWEWIIIDDCSSDDTFAVAEELAEMDRRVCALRFPRNFGSHIATICGLEHARGSCPIAMASDLQDPPEAIPELLSEWRAGNHVVWAVRASREGEPRSTVLFSRFYYWLMRKVAGLRDMPATGADFVLLDRTVIDAVCRFREQNASFFALVTWMGFRQTSISYEKQARLHGRSGWTLRKKIKLVVDSLTSFTYQPIRWMSLIGLLVSVLGVVYAGILVLNALLGSPAQGWTSLMVIVLFLGGGQMFMLGVLGEYIWRGLDESRRRPRYLIEKMTGEAILNKTSRAEPQIGVSRGSHLEYAHTDDPTLSDTAGHRSL
jgi:polyisoprenyl-phosphate glycosyltransferase